jgi:sulfofructose kinase
MHYHRRMSAASQVIGVGHITCDVICPLQGWPEVDTKTIIPGIKMAGGGPTSNAIAALAKLGVPCGLAGKLGDDVLGRYALDAHAREGIDTSRIMISADSVSPVSIILSDLTSGTRTILLTKGERTTLVPAEMDWDWLKQARVIHLDGHQMPASLAVAREARSWQKVSVVLDAGSLREGMLELCALCDIVIASQRFIRQLTAAEDTQQRLEALHATGAPQVGITLGTDGSVFSDGHQSYFQPAFDVAVQDTTGAGDSYHGGFIYGILHGAEPQECMRVASAVAALKCRGLGARETQPTPNELHEFLATNYN